MRGTSPRAAVAFAGALIGVLAAAMLLDLGAGPARAEIPLPEKDELKFGFIKLTDMAPLAIAKELGYFEEEGLYVTLEPQANWKVLLDRVITGELDGAHMLAGQPIAATIGFGTRAHIITPFSMDLNGNGITVSNEVWTMSLPDANRVRSALARCDFVVVSDLIAGTDTGRFAHVLLPAAGWGEKDGTVTNSERRISRQRRFLEAPGEAKPDWWIITEVARRMGFGDAFRYERPADIFREHAALSALENDGRRAFDIGALAHLSDKGYDAFEPMQWPVPEKASEGTARLFADGRFFTPDGRARFIAVRPAPPANATDLRFPFVLNTGRLRDQWHSMTRTGLSPRLARHAPEPAVELHPIDAEATGLAAGGFARVRTPWGAGIFRVAIHDGQRRGSLFLPIHWTDAFAADAVAGRLANPATDPLSGQPEFKHTPAAIEPFEPAWRGFLMSRAEVAPPRLAYWARVPLDGGHLYELAADERDAGPPSLEALAGSAGEGGERIEMHDRALGLHRVARLDGGRLTHCLMLARSGALPPRDWLAGLFAGGRLDDPDRATLLSGRRAGAVPSGGPAVCACFGVGAETLWRAIRTGGLTSLEAVGAALEAGTNCGSCRPEISMLLARASEETAA